MRSAEQLEAELSRILEENYYTEDYELRWTIQRFEQGLEREEREYFNRIVIRRLTEDPSIVAVMLASSARIPEAVPVLISILDQQAETGMLTRSLLAALASYGDPSAFAAVERFLDSDQEVEALLSLGHIHFERSLFHLIRSGRRKHMRDACLQVLHERRQEAGLPRLIADLVRFAGQSQDNVTGRTRAILTCKEGPYNPFTPQEIRQILDVVSD